MCLKVFHDIILLVEAIGDTKIQHINSLSSVLEVLHLFALATLKLVVISCPKEIEGAK